MKTNSEPDLSVSVSLKEKARHYHDLGFNVLPVKIVVENGKENKKPNVHSWKRGQTLRMTEEEFNGLPWDTSEYFGVICGFNGFISIDADNLSEDQYGKVDAILNQPVTEKIRTKRGHHWNFQSMNVRRGDKKTQEKKSLEYLGVGNFVIVGGVDTRYQRVNDNPPRQISDAHAVYKRALEALGWIKKPPLKQPTDLKEIRPCITAALNGKPLKGSEGDKMRLCCAVEYLQAGYDVNHVVEVFRRAPAIQIDFNEEITRKKVKYAKEQEYKTWKCENIYSLGFCIGVKECEWVKKFRREKGNKYRKTGTKVGNYWLKMRGKKAFLFDDAGSPVVSCNLDSVDGPQFKKKLREIAGLDEAEVNRSTASFMFALQSLKRGSTEEKEKPKEITFEEEVEDKARALLRDPSFFYKLGRVFHYGFVVPKINRPRFVIGEERNTRLLPPLLLGAAKLEMTSITKMLGGIGTAKDSMVRMALVILESVVKAVERAYVTPASLRYSKEMKDADLLYIPDSPELRGEMGRHLRFMRADDGGLISEYAMKDPETGEMTTKVSKIPVKAIATTSNAITGDPALESGMWNLSSDDCEDLTLKVKKAKLALRAGKRCLFPADELKVWQCAFKLLATEEVPDVLPGVPFAEELLKLLESTRSESRRDPDKLCDLISLIAWTRRFQKKPEHRGNADLFDLFFALQLGLDAITQTISELDDKELKIYNSVKSIQNLSEAEQKTLEETKKIEGTIGATCREVAQDTKIPYKTCYSYLEKLIIEGFLNKGKERGKNFYNILSAKTPATFLMSERRNAEDAKNLMEFILCSVEGFSLSHQERDRFLIDPLTARKLNINIVDGAWQLSLEDADEKIKGYPFPGEKGRSAKRSEETLLKAQKEPTAILPSETRKETITDEKKGIIPLSFDELHFRDGPHQLVGEMYHEGECFRCKQTTEITAYYNDFKGNKHDLCSECIWILSKELSGQKPRGKKIAQVKPPISDILKQLKTGPHDLAIDEYHKDVCYCCLLNKEIVATFEDHKGENHNLCGDCAYLLSEEQTKQATKQPRPEDTSPKEEPWQDFHSIGRYDPATAYKKTVESIRELQKSSVATVLTKKDVDRIISWYWKKESYDKVWELLRKEKIVDFEDNKSARNCSRKCRDFTLKDGSPFCESLQSFLAAEGLPCDHFNPKTEEPIHPTREEETDQ